MKRKREQLRQKAWLVLLIMTLGLALFYSYLCKMNGEVIAQEGPPPFENESPQSEMIQPLFVHHLELDLV